MNDLIFNPGYLAASQREIEHHRTQFENRQPELQYFDIEEIPFAHKDMELPPPSVEGQQIAYFIWKNAYFKDYTEHALAVRYNGALVWVYRAVQDEFWGKQKIMS